VNEEEIAMFIENRIRTSRRHPRGSRSGFTLVELLLVLVILATLAAIVIPKFSGRTEQAKMTAARTQISNLETAIDAYDTDLGAFPNGSDGLRMLTEKPANVDDWHGPYMKKNIPADPWGHPYIYECPGKHNENGYDLMSAGPDGQPGTADDITNWETK
jgi:general secretion pathway protein G